jgi:tetratricopeptide (TPR) repeat protein
VSGEGTAAVQAFRTGDLSAAESSLASLPAGLSAAAPDHGRGVLAYYRGDRAAARRFFDAAMQRDPAYAPPVAAVVRMLLSESKPGEARSFVESRRQASNNAPSIEALSLYVDLAERRFEDVIRNARAVLLRDERNLDAYYCLAEANLGLGRSEIARYIADQAISRDAGRPDFYFVKARIELAANNATGARNFFKRVIDLDPNHPEARNNLGVLLLRARDFDGAIESLQVATRVVPGFVEAWNNLGSALKGAKRYDEAKAAFDRALSLAPNDPTAVFNLGLLYFDAEFGGETKVTRMDKAAQFFRAYVDKAPQGPAVDRARRYATEAETAARTERELQSDGGSSSSPDTDDQQEPSEPEAPEEMTP